MSVLNCSDDLRKLFLNFAYPIGSVYMTRTDNDPNVLFGGTWVKNDNAYIYAMSGNVTDGYRGTGTKTVEHKLTESQMPKHYHSSVYWNGPNGMPVMMSYISSNIDGFNLNWESAKVHSTTSNLSTGYTGGSEGHSHSIPWIGVHFWYRTA